MPRVQQKVMSVPCALNGSPAMLDASEHRDRQALFCRRHTPAAMGGGVFPRLGLLCGVAEVQAAPKRSSFSAMVVSQRSRSKEFSF
jgi:hypothetical protein